MIFKKQVLINSFPAYNIFSRCQDANGIVQITVDDTLGLKGDGFYYQYSPGSVVSYALSNNDDPIAAVERSKKLGHKLHWINADAVCLSSSPQARKDLVSVYIGMRVCFEGLHATIEKAPNSNLRFKPIPVTEF